MNYYFINTDKKSLGGNPHLHWVANGFAYVTPSNDTQYKNVLRGFKKGDYVFAYENQVGVVAVGQVQSEWDELTYNAEPGLYPSQNESIYKVKVKWIPGANPISIAEIKSTGVPIIPAALYSIKDVSAANELISIFKSSSMSNALGITGDNWSDEELRASIAAYLEMHQKERLNEKFIKKHYYAALAEQFGRSEKAFEYRMQNISYVLSLMGRDWMQGLKPAKNVGANVAECIEKIIGELEGQHFSPVVALEIQVNSEINKSDLPSPNGSQTPEKSTTTVTQFTRDAKVKAWVLKNAGAKCECCQKLAPFFANNGIPYLEVHHLRRLADGGSDTISNAVALCPNCHRELHFGSNKITLINDLFSRTSRLVRE
jgi:5-methylcytosine-specific restriction protein A